MSYPAIFASQDEYDAWLADLHAVESRLKRLNDDVDAKMLAMKADAAGVLGGGILSSALPEEVVDGLRAASRIRGFLPFVPDGMLPTWVEKLADILDAVRRALGVSEQ